MDTKGVDTLDRTHGFLGPFLWRVNQASEKEMDNAFLELRSKERVPALPFMGSTLTTEIYLLDKAGEVVRRVGNFLGFTVNRSVARELRRLDDGAKRRIVYAVVLRHGCLVLYTVPRPYHNLEEWREAVRTAPSGKNRTNLRLVS